MWAASLIHRSLINSRLPTTAPADERAAPDEILVGELPADGPDERRITRHDYGSRSALPIREGINGALASRRRKEMLLRV